MIRFTRVGWESLGDLIKRNRMKLKLSMAQMVDLLNNSNPEVLEHLGVSTLSSLEKGNTEPRLTTLAQLANSGEIRNLDTGEPLDLNKILQFVIDRS